jgi:hypothetical protein
LDVCWKSGSISGTVNNIPKFTGTGAIGNSAVTDNGTTINAVGRSLTIGSIADGAGDFLTKGAGGLVQSRTAAEALTDLSINPTPTIVTSYPHVMSSSELVVFCE